jgi:hypothetical protein
MSITRKEAYCYLRSATERLDTFLILGRLRRRCARKISHIVMSMDRNGDGVSVSFNDAFIDSLYITSNDNMINTL